MKRLDFEEKNNQKRAFLLSTVIHAILFSYIAYAGLQMMDDYGTVEIEFVTAGNAQGVQLQKFKEANSTANAQAQFKATKAPEVKAPAKKPKAKKSKVAKATEVRESDVLVKKPKKEKPTPKKEVKKEEPKLIAKEDSDSVDEELAELEKELTPAPVMKELPPKKLKPKPAPKNAELAKENLEGKNKFNAAEEIAQYGKNTKVRSHHELTPYSGNPKPRYPDEARRKRYAPKVVVDYLVNSEGQVADIKFVQPAQLGSINRSVFEAIRRWKFKPGKTGYFRHEIVFSLKGEAQIIPARLRRSK
jgi:protein TonB